MNIFFNLFKRKQNRVKNSTVIISGLPRSGTSMMMRMLEAGGLAPFTDHIRKPDNDNPKGYYEFERVKKLEKDKSWLPEAKGKAVKIISILLKHLPSEYEYKVIFMHRNMEEILASQARMLARRGKDSSSVTDDELSKKFNMHLKNIKEWLANQPNFDVMYVTYHEVIQNRRDHCIKINEFLGNRLDVKQMIGAIDKTLYRNKR